MGSATTESSLDVTWRAMRDDDLSIVASLEAEIHAAPWTLMNFRDALHAGNSARVGIHGGRIAAYGILMLAPGEAQLLNLSVITPMRRRGLATRLLRQFLFEAQSRGAVQVFLEVRASNVPAIGLYEREGFCIIARRASYYPAARETPASREDALVMRRAVIGPLWAKQ